MKKTYISRRSFLKISAAAAAAGALAACGASGSSTAASTAASSAAASTAASTAASASGDTIRVAFVPQLIGIPYFTAMDDGGQRAAKDLGCTWIYAGDTQASADLQVQQMDSLIRQGVDALCLSVLDSSSTNPKIEEAQAAGIIAYTSDSDATDSTRSYFVSQADNTALGETLMEQLAQQIGGAGKVGIVSGNATATNLNAWIDAMTAYAAKKYPDIQILDVRYTSSGSSEEALEQAQSLITANPDLKGLVGVASSTIPGVCQAVEQAGETGNIAVIGYGSPATVKDYIAEGIMKVSILWDAEALGYLTCWVGYQAVKGNEITDGMRVDGIDGNIAFDKTTGIITLGDPLVITADNVNDFSF
jgi:ABC-type sugar transport system substrate-binding protein